MNFSEYDPLFPKGTRVWIDTDSHEQSTISFPVTEDGRVLPNEDPPGEPHDDNSDTDTNTDA